MKTDSRLLTAYGPNFLQSFRMHITYLPNVRFTVKHIYAVYSAQTYSISMYPHETRLEPPSEQFGAYGYRIIKCSRAYFFAKVPYTHV
jgi:hypothetical protein